MEKQQQREKNLVHVKPK